MNKKFILVIPIAGSSTRYLRSGYNLHKAFLPIGSTFVLDSIIQSQASKCSEVVIICTHEQKVDYSPFLEVVSRKHDSVRIASIDRHDMGPTKTLYDGLLSIDSDLYAPILVHYCDFLVDDRSIDYYSLLDHADIVAPVFTGFHPASFGSTKYAYLKLDHAGYMLDLKEKDSFTSNRINEPASTGIYIFSNIQLFLKLAEELLSDETLWVGGEAYTSLCLVIALSKGMLIKSAEVSKFICLGTPEDYSEHKYWENAYHHFHEQHDLMCLPLAHLITAAGKGTRFSSLNYDQPKIFLDFMGRSLIEWATQSIGFNSAHILTLTPYVSRVNKLDSFSDLNLEVFSTDTSPRDQLTSLKILASQLVSAHSVLVSSADYWFNIDQFAFLEFLVLNNPDVVIFTTEWISHVHASIDNYGFALSDNQSQLLQVDEKKTVLSDPRMLEQLVIGSFWFRHNDLISTINPSSGGSGEVFIASSIASMIDTHKVMTFPVKAWISLGTPQELLKARYWFEHIHQLRSEK